MSSNGRWAWRGFGWILVFLLLAGEIYTTFTFLGARVRLFLRAGKLRSISILAYGSLPPT